MPVLSAQDLKKSFGDRAILDGVTLTIRTGERVGLVGINGSGKSTLAKILAGQEPADSGSVARRKGARVAYLAQEPSFDESKTGREIVLSGLSAWSEAKARHEEASAALASGGSGEGDEATLLASQAEAAADLERLGGWDVGHEASSLLTALGVERPDAPVSEMSGGERRRVAIAEILVARPDLAILDEPSNHLDVDTVAWLEGYLTESFRGAVLFVTHDRYLLDRVATRTLELDRGVVYAYEGGYEDYLEAKAERLAHLARTEQNRQNFLRRELEWLRRQPKARGTKQKARIGRAEAAKGMEKPAEERAAELRISSARSGKTVLEVRGLAIQAGGTRLASGLDLTLVPGDRVGIVGRSGVGKTTLLRTLLGEQEPAEGSVKLGQNAKITYLDQRREGLDESKSVFENVAGDRSRLLFGGEEIEIRSYLERFLFDGQAQRRPVSALSGGERARALLAKILSHPANLVVLDEPTNDLDLQTLGALEQLLVEAEATALVVTHDRYFLDRVATSILAFEGDGKLVRTAGNYADYLVQRSRTAEASSTAKPSTSKTAPAPERPRKAEKGGERPLTYAERLELEGILEKVAEAEEEASRLEAELANPSLYSQRGAEVPSLHKALEAARAEVASRTARWEELERRSTLK